MFSTDDIVWAKEAFSKCEKKYEWVARKHKTGIPYTTDLAGNYDDRADATKAWRIDDGINWWTNGFWGGIMWHLYKSTGKMLFAEIAASNEALLDRCFSEYYGLHHDVGFMWLPTAVASYKLTGNPESRKRALHAANLLSGRFNLSGRFIRAWNDLEGNDTRGWAIIDCMLNIPLLYWANEETADPRFKQIAIAHADTVMRAFIRKDGSSHHIVEFDPETGVVLKPHGGQGYREGSAWTRGQAWALYGFVISYNCTGKREYLETAKRVADYFVAHIPDSGLIPIDFDQPPSPELEDSCGAAIAACGLIEIARHCHGDTAEKYRNAALKLLRALDACRCDYTDKSDAILTHCSGAYHSPSSHHISMTYADYFHLDALYKIQGRFPEFYW